MLTEPELAAVFAEATGALDGIERRKMFGYPAVFINGNMIAGLHRDSMVMRLAPGDLDEIIAREGAVPFVAMGRTMRGWVVVPPELVGRGDELRLWLGKALVYAASLPAKPPRRKRPA